MSTPPDVFSPAKLGPITLRNRIIKAATFEARTPDALVTDDLIEYHRLPAAGGVGMTTVAYCAVSPGGRVHPHCMVLRFHSRAVGISINLGEFCPEKENLGRIINPPQ